MAQLTRNQARAVQNTALRQFTKDMDAGAREVHMKYERMSFSVVGEGSQSANENYHRNYSLIQWEESHELCQHQEVLSSRPAGDESAVGH